MAKKVLAGNRIEPCENVEVETIGGFCDSIEYQLEQAESQCLKGDPETGLNLLNEIWKQYLSFRDILVVYRGTDLGEQIVKSLACASVLVKHSSPISNGICASANRTIVLRQ